MSHACMRKSAPVSQFLHILVNVNGRDITTYIGKVLLISAL